mmetsp:Transcript_36709/g.83103  ORF Transcript_36709/g.83103 Transcript_36709/m.83103 type:complete len:206 (+) Transcript_36709:509-1126(+)
MLLVARVFVEIDELDNVLRTKGFEERHLSHKRLFRWHKLERDPPFRFHVDRKLYRIQPSHTRTLLHFIAALVQIRCRILALTHATHRGYGSCKLFARPNGCDPHLAQVIHCEFHQSIEIHLLSDKHTSVLTETQPLKPCYQLVASILAGPPPTTLLTPLAEIALSWALIHDPSVKDVQISTAAKTSEHVHLRPIQHGSMPIPWLR